LLLLPSVGRAQWAGSRGLEDRGNVPEWQIDPAFRSDVFSFARLRYTSWGGRGWGGWGRSRGRWATDAPEADLNLAFRLALFAGGHCLITGAPGLAKTLLVKSIAQIFHLKFQRIQFTPDLMPADITGTEILQDPTGPAPVPVRPRPGLRQHHPRRRNQPHPAQNPGRPARSHAGTPGHRRRHPPPAPEPFFVLATQNPIEMEGTYPLPEAQLDRFMFNVVIDYLPEADEVTGGSSPGPIGMCCANTRRRRICAAGWCSTRAVP
jgi:hypothetical protein